MEHVATAIKKSKRGTTLKRTLVYSLHNRVIEDILESRKRYGSTARLTNLLKSRFDIYKLSPEELESYVSDKIQLPFGEEAVDILLLNGCVLKIGQDESEFLSEEIIRITHPYSYVIIVSLDEKFNHLSPNISNLKAAEEQTEEALKFIITTNMSFKFNNQLTEYYDSHLLRYLELRFNIGENMYSSLPSIILARIW